MTGQAESRIVRSRFSEEQIIAVLKESEAGVKTGELCQRHGSRGRVFISISGRISSVSGKGLACRMPLAEPHSNAHHLSNHFGLLRVAKHPRRHRGKGMRLQNNFLAGQGAPAAGNYSAI